MLFAILAWPWLTFGALMIFRWSMRRAKVRAGHVARCVVYGFDWGFWLVPLVLLLMTDRRAADVLHSADPRVTRLRRVRHVPPRRGVRELPPLRAPYETAMATQLIVLLVVMAFALN